jgi:hypothetical protein
MKREYCGGCEGHGSHWRWCPKVVGFAASRFGQLAQAAENLGDSVGPNEMAAANHLYAASGLLRALAFDRRDEFQTRTAEENA